MACHRINSAIIVAIYLAISIFNPSDAIINNKIDRIIDLSSQLVKITERIHLVENPGLYTIKLEPSHKEKLAYIDGNINGDSIDPIEQSDGTYVFDLSTKDVKQPLVVTTVFARLLEPYPVEITQSERQLVRYQGLQTTLSPYLTKTITTKIKLPQNSRLESFTKATKMTTGSNKLTYGPFKDVQPDQAEQLTVHYENNSPFVAVTSLTRSIEISPWVGVMHVANHIKVAHVGAKLKGPFSRIDYQRDHSNGLSSVKNFAAELPRTAKDIYFRDGIGNISTSSVKTTSGQIVVNIKPRFPLFGGWVTDFNLGYKAPLKDFLNEPASGSNYRLSIPFTDVIYENMYIQEATLKVTLPAGASNIDVKGPIKFERLADELNYSYLDVIGRPIVVIRKQNIVSQHVDAKPIVIRYNYSKMYMIQEPILLLSVGIGAILASIGFRVFKN